MRIGHHCVRVSELELLFRRFECCMRVTIAYLSDFTFCRCSVGVSVFTHSNRVRALATGTFRRFSIHRIRLSVASFNGVPLC